jgi:hypothetical protein
VSPRDLQSPDDRGDQGVKALIWIKRRRQTIGQIAQLFMPLKQMKRSLFAYFIFY